MEANSSRYLLMSVCMLGALLLPVRTSADLIGINLNGVMVNVDPDTGDAQIGFGTDQFGTFSLARGPTGSLISVNSDQQLVTFPDHGGPASILLQLSVSGSTDFRITALAYSNEHGLVGHNDQISVGRGLYRFDLATGNGVRISNTSPTVTQALEFSPDGTLFGFDPDFGLFTFDFGTGFTIDVNPVLVEPNFSAIAFDEDGRLIGTLNDGFAASYFEIDPGTGLSSLLSTGPRTIIRGMVAVPEPSTAAMLLFGIGVMAVRASSLSCARSGRVGPELPDGALGEHRLADR
jgi:hypothetical protein